MLASGSVPSSLVTITILEDLKKSGFNYDDIILVTLGIMLVLTAFIILIKNRLISFIQTNHSENLIVKLIKNYRPLITVLCGCMLGCVVTISSVGAGAIGSALLFLLYPRKPSISIVGTDIAHAVPLTAIAGLGHMHFGSVDFNLLFGLLAGGVPAIYLGSFLGKKLPDTILRPLIAMLLLAMGIKLILTQQGVMACVETTLLQIEQFLFSLWSNLQQ